MPTDFVYIKCENKYVSCYDPPQKLQWTLDVKQAFPMTRISAESRLANIRITHPKADIVTKD